MAEPDAKRQRKDFTGYTLNINKAVDKEYEVRSFTEIADAPVIAVEGIAEKGSEALAAIGVHTVRDLGCCKYYRWAKAVVTLAAREAEGGRAEGTFMNIDGAVVKEYEKMSLGEISNAPVEALQGISAKMAEGLAAVHVHTVADFANNKYAAWSEAIATLAEVEKLETEKRMLKSLE